jgi:hypothetical protein
MDTSIFSNLNWLAVLAAGAAYFLLGAVWYSLLFSKAWIRSSGVNVNDPKMKTGMAQTMFTSFIFMVIASIGLALIIYKIGTYTWMTGAKVGLVAGVCFSATAISISYLYEKRPFALHLINGVYSTIGCIIAGIILSVWPK